MKAGTMQPDAIPTDWMTDFAAQRRMMVECQVRPFNVTDHPLLTAMLNVPRERFVAPQVVALAYADGILPAAGSGRAMLPPMILARMIQAARIKPTDKVLDLAGGAGYGAALLARLAGQVVTLESVEAASVAARTAVGESDAKVVLCATGPLRDGYPGGAPYDVIIVNGAFQFMPQPLLDQLSDGGRLIGIDAMSGAPKAVRYERTGGDFSRRPLFDAGAPILEGFQEAATFVF
jgi:protein-L-isoaspartate(D-aspartate) O-methyltransferase